MLTAVSRAITNSPEWNVKSREKNPQRTKRLANIALKFPLTSILNIQVVLVS